MGNSGQVLFDIRTGWPDAGSGSGSGPEFRRSILCPALRGLPQEAALDLAILPIHDANGLLLDAIAQPGAGAAPDYAGVCLSDPFRRIDDIFEALRAAGVGGVVNLPTVWSLVAQSDDRLFDDLCEREETLLAQARATGLRTLRIARGRLWSAGGGEEEETCLGRFEDLVRICGPGSEGVPDA